MGVGLARAVEDRELGPLEAFSTDFTEVRYGNGGRKAHLMAVVDLERKYACGWAVGPNPNSSWSSAAGTTFANR
jgi:transposase InsO family protein